MKLTKLASVIITAVCLTFSSQPDEHSIGNTHTMYVSLLPTYVVQ